ncbi:hypothetical protein ACWGPW_27840 [Paenibacillus chitinolyticus]
MKGAYVRQADVWKRTDVREADVRKKTAADGSSGEGRLTAWPA